MRQETVDNWHRAKTRLASESATVSKDMYQEVLDRCVIEFGMDANSTRKLVDQGHPDVMRVWNKIADEKLQNLIPEINRGKQQVSGAKAERALNDFTDKHDGLINKNPSLQIKESAAKSGLNIDNEQFTANIHGKEGTLKGKFEKVTGKNTEQYHNVRQASEIEQKDLQAQVNKYEKDRIGQGKIARKTAGALDIVTFGKAGETIGGPAKGSQKVPQLSKGVYQNARQVKPKDE